MCACSSSDSGEPQQPPVEDKLVLAVDPDSILADGKETATFTVTLGELDVTAQAVITNKTTGVALPEGESSFTSTVAGEVEFTAAYDGKTSNSVKVTVSALPSPKGKVTLKADKTILLPDGQDAAVFTVMYDEEDVTADAVITNLTTGNPLTADGNGKFSYTTESQQNAEFSAEYDGVTSDPVTISVRQNKPYYKSSVTLRFTSTGCKPCYDLAENFKKLEPTYGDRLLMASIHGSDALMSSATTPYMEYIGVNSYPTCSIGLRYKFVATQSTEYISERVDDVLSHPATCGIAIKSTVTENVADVTVKLASGQDDDYYLVILLLEDGVTGYPQSSNGGTINDYVHDNTVRGAGTVVTGEPLGEIKAGNEAEVKCTFRVSKYDTANCRVVAYAVTETDKGMVINTAADCPVNGSVDYRYE